MPYTVQEFIAYAEADRPRLIRIAFSKLPTNLKAHAEDVVQDALLYAWKSLANIHVLPGFTTTIVMRLCMRFIKYQRARSRDMSKTHSLDIAFGVSLLMDLDSALIRRQRLQRLPSFLAALSPAQRTSIAEDLNGGDDLDRCSSPFRNDLHRAKAKLKHMVRSAGV